MIIRSQSGRSIIVISNVDTIGCDNYGTIYSWNGDKTTRVEIATYKTKEKAIKVLDMICEQYQYCQECKCGGMGVNKAEFVFQMPQDSEV